MHNLCLILSFNFIILKRSLHLGNMQLLIYNNSTYVQGNENVITLIKYIDIVISVFYTQNTT